MDSDGRRRDDNEDVGDTPERLQDYGHIIFPRFSVSFLEEALEFRALRGLFFFFCKPVVEWLRRYLRCSQREKSGPST